MRSPSNNERMLFAAAFVLLCGSFVTLRLTLPAEDAVILFEYSKNLADKGLISYGNATVPIEGATDFLWMLVIAAMRKLGMPEFLSALLLNCVGVLGILALIKPFKARLIYAAGLVCTSYLYASVLGFSALFFSAAYCWSVSGLLQNRRSFYPSILLLCLIRPDGVVWGAGLIALRFFDLKTDVAALKKESVYLMVGLIFPGAVYFAWRAWYFSEWLPLPLLVKASGQRDLWIFFRLSLIDIAFVLIPALAAGFFSSDRGLYAKRLFFLFALPCVFYGTMRLDQNIGNRFLAPMYFGATLLLSDEKRLKPLLVFTVASILLLLPTTLNTMNQIVRSRSENVFYISNDLAALDGKMLITEAGRLAYYSNWRADDSWGLNTPAYAHHLVARKDLETNAYDLIVAHCDLDLLGKQLEDRTSDDRSWVNQCETLVYFMRLKNYEIYLVPNLMKKDIASDSTAAAFEQFKDHVKAMLGERSKDSACLRYDIYAVSPTFRYAAELGKILVRRRAVTFSAEMFAHEIVDGDRLCAHPGSS